MGAVGELLGHSFSLGTSLALFFGAILTLLFLYHLWFQSLRSTKLGNKIPGFSPLPVVGDAYLAFNKHTAEEIFQLGCRMMKERGKLARAWFGNRLFLAIADPRDVEIILGSSVHLEKSSDYKLFEPWLGDGLLISKGEKWRNHRKMIAPTFHQTILKTFVEVFNKNAKELVENLRRTSVGKVCDIHDYMSGTTVDVLLETVMGVQGTKETKSSFQYAKAVMDMCEILHFRHTKLWWRLDFLFKLTQMFRNQKSYLNIIHSLTNKVIKTKKGSYFLRAQKGEGSLYNMAVKEVEEEAKTGKSENEMNFGSALRDDLDDDLNVGEKKRLAFLDFMIEASQTEGNKLSDEEIRDQVNTIMFEGHDTTAAASSFFLCILGAYPEIQDKVYEELKGIFQDSNRPVTFNDTFEMKYLERVLLEALRLYPPVPMIARTNRAEFKLASADYIVPKNTTIIIPQFVIHRDPDYYPNPEKFDPDNFLPERCQQRHYYSFVPFSAGPRSCVGRKYAMLKLKIILASIVRNFTVKSVVEEKDFKLQGDIILKRADGFRVILENRR